MSALAQAFRAACAERLLAGDVITASRYLHEAHKLEAPFYWADPLVAACGDRDSADAGLSQALIQTNS